MKKILQEYIDSYKIYCKQIKLAGYKPVPLKNWVTFYSIHCLSQHVLANNKKT